MGRVLESGLLAQLIACVTNYRDAGRAGECHAPAVGRPMVEVAGGRVGARRGRCPASRDGSEPLGRLAQLDELLPDADPAPVHTGPVDYSPERCNRTLTVLNSPGRVGDADRDGGILASPNADGTGAVIAEDGIVLGFPLRGIWSASQRSGLCVVLVGHE
jgi:hypothetical protein